MTPHGPATPVRSRARSRSVSVLATLGAALIAVALFGFIAPGDGTTTLAQVHAGSADAHRHDRAVTSTSAVPQASMPVAQSQAAAPLDLAPVAVRIPSIGVDSQLVRLGLNADGTLEVPKDFSVAGWYVYRSVPGEPGPSIIAGHVDSETGPAVFFRLQELEPGADIEVERSDGSVAVFRVTAREQYDKDAFPTEKVYGPTLSPQLRVITCGGTFDWNTRHYNDNVVVFAELQRLA
jgi:sortase (surface protein transpeptidase)